MSMTARRQAEEHMTLNNFVGEPRRVADTHCKNAPAWTIIVTATSAVIVYEDDPHSVCSVGNEPGRFIDC